MATVAMAALNQSEVDARVLVGINHVFGEEIAARLSKFENQFTETAQALSAVKQDFEATNPDTVLEIKAPPAVFGHNSAA